MILIPQRLFKSEGVQIILKDGNVCILSKALNRPVLRREGYISNHVISMVLSGEQHIRNYDGQLLVAKAGEMLFIPRGMYVISDLLPQKEMFKSLLFYFDDLLIQDFLSVAKSTKTTKENIPNYLKFKIETTLQSFADSLITIYSNPHLKDKHFLHLKILEMLHLLDALGVEQELASFLFRLTLPKKRHIKSFMEANFSKPLKVADYAYLTGRSLSTFRRDFKASFGCTPQKWIKNKRLDKALSILNEREVSVTELGVATGYENISYFIKEFKGRFGLSPKQYSLSKNKDFLL
ncbi:AraC family transcriptional regulator [Aureispira sp. CCB-E]|uniref:helix-turn-helix domain-containing protein n=1 Tax=Aureispira sp. CCB-E TaxID=3051121 RepID=UPI0028685428|nr:AraC family transcriptional regulator [Aureispira sp. CCB-E]WMX13055.1 AraC family transcriptional regulator [Aureispira sp. CCB-E]